MGVGGVEGIVSRLTTRFRPFRLGDEVLFLKSSERIYRCAGLGFRTREFFRLQ